MLIDEVVDPRLRGGVPAQECQESRVSGPGHRAVSVIVAGPSGTGAGDRRTPLRRSRHGPVAAHAMAVQVRKSGEAGVATGSAAISGGTSSRSSSSSGFSSRTAATKPVGGWSPRVRQRMRSPRRDSSMPLEVTVRRTAFLT